MKTILIACYETPGYGGASTASYGLFERMQGDGVPVAYLNLIPVEVATFLEAQAGPGFDNPRGLCHVHTYRFEDALDASHPALADLVREVAPDLVIAVGYIAALMLRRAAPDRPLIFFTAGCDQMNGYLALGRTVGDVRAMIRRSVRPVLFHANERRAVEGADLVIAHAELIRELYTHFYAGHRGKIYRDVIWMAEWIWGEAARHGTLGRPFEERDVDVLFIASRWDRPEKNYPIVRAIIADCADLNIHVVGIVPGPVAPATGHGMIASREELFALMGRCRTVVSPSLFDAAPGILFEAAALGCNIVASRNCGNWRICNDELLVESAALQEYLEKTRLSIRKRFPDNADWFLRARNYARLMDIAEVL